MIPREHLDTIDLSDVATDEQLSLVAPGDILREEFMDPRGLSARRLARALDVPANRITAILRGERAVTAETAIRLGEYFGTSPEFWLNLQVAADLDAARRARAQPIGSVQPARAPAMAASITRAERREQANRQARRPRLKP